MDYDITTEVAKNFSQYFPYNNMENVIKEVIRLQQIKIKTK